jgi:hypothetical protein
VQGTERGSTELWIQLLIDVASVTNCHDHNEEDSIVDRVNDPVVAHPQPIAGPSSKWARRWRTWILSEKCDGALNARLHGAVNLANLTQSCWPELDPKVGHDQPRSIFTCSQGMLFPSSANAASNATTSCNSSKASSISS